MSPKNILITGARAPISLDLARSFRAADLCVQLADCIPAYAAKMSKLGPIMRLPPPRFKFQLFAKELRDFCTLNPDALIVPTCEEVFFVSAAAQKYNFEDQVFASELSILRRLHSKIEFPNLLKALGLPFPHTEHFAERSQVCDGQQLVLKPEFSRFGSATIIQPDQRQLNRISAKGEQRWAAQEFIQGREFCLWSAARGGQLVASVVYAPKWRHGQTAAYAFEAIEAPQVVEIAAQIAKSLNYTGQLSLDLIRTSSGEFIPIECNPRGVSGIHLFDCHASLARAICGNGAPVKVTEGLRHLAPAMWLMGLPKSIMDARLSEWRNDITMGQDALCRDLGMAPAIGALIDATRFATIGLSRFRSPAGQTTDDIEWNGEEIA